MPLVPVVSSVPGSPWCVSLLPVVSLEPGMSWVYLVSLMFFVLMPVVFVVFPEPLVSFLLVVSSVPGSPWCPQCLWCP